MMQRKPLEPEWMDDDAVDVTELGAALGFIRRINSLLGYTRATVKEILRPPHPSGSLSILDVACGTNDVGVALLARARAKQIAASVVGIDRHHKTLRWACDWTRHDAAAAPFAIAADALRLPFADASFDVVTSSMFLHHLPEELAVASLREMGRVARSRVVVADLHRTKSAYRWIKLFTAFSTPMIKHDARVSVLQAFSSSEAADLARRAGLANLAITTRFGHRWILTAKPA